MRNRLVDIALALLLAAALLLLPNKPMWKPAHAGVSCSVPFNLTNGTTADASQVMANYNAILACLANNTAASGANSDITSLSSLSTPISQVQGGTIVYTAGTSTGSANAQVVAVPVPGGFSLSAKSTIVFIAGFTNTGATQLNVNGTGLTNVFRMSPSGPQALTGGEIVLNNLTVATYDGVQYELLSTQAQFGGLGPTTNLNSATTTDLGTIPSHNVSVSGVTTITSFGSSASLTYPYYRLIFTGALTLTYNASSLIVPGASNITTAANDTALAMYLGSGNWQIQSYNRATANVAGKAVTVQSFTTGTAATYTTPTNPSPLYLILEMCGGGGGGGGASANTGAVGTDSSFGTWTAIHGNGGASANGAGGAGGTGGVNGTGTVIVRQDGGKGNVATGSGSTGIPGAIGGANIFGGGGPSPGGVTATAGLPAVTNSCAGGGGGVSSSNNGSGGGAGEYVKALITSLSATYTYTVGAGGNGGAAGTAAGGNGAAGRIIVYEFYN